MKRLLAILLLACLPLIGMAGEIKIDGPASPVEVADVVTLGVLGIPDADLPKAVVSVTPQTGATLRPVRSWSNQPELLFIAKTPGSYRITVAINGWREPISAGLNQAKAAAIGAPQLDPKFVRLIDGLTTDLIQTYPISSASCVVEVAGSPFEPNDPNPPDNPNPPPLDPSNPSRVSRVTYVYEKDQGNVPRQVSAALQQLNDTGVGGFSVVATEFEEDTLDGDNQIPDQYKVAWTETRRPDVGVPALIVEGPSGTVLRIIKAPTTTEQVLTAAKGGAK